MIKLYKIFLLLLIFSFLSTYNPLELNSNTKENNSFLPLIKKDKISLKNNENESFIKLAQDIWDSSISDEDGNPEWMGL